MADRSAIEWTQTTWNPVTGCSRVSPGCWNCYAERMARRLQAMGCPNYANGFQVSVHEDALTLPFRWSKHRFVFVNSMSDLFHEDIPDAFIFRVFEVMQAAQSHTFQVLTKRSGRLRAMSSRLPWPTNLWMGVSVEDPDRTYRIDDLRMTGARLKFVSFEPLLGPIDDVNLEGIGWVIVGGESGPRARPVESDWVVRIRNLCLRSSVPFFFKQWGGWNKRKTGRLLEGQLWEQMPTGFSSPRTTDRMSA